jgi:hypothetical protein
MDIPTAIVSAVIFGNCSVILKFLLVFYYSTLVRRHVISLYAINLHYKQNCIKCIIFAVSANNAYNVA